MYTVYCILCLCSFCYQKYHTSHSIYQIKRVHITIIRCISKNNVTSFRFTNDPSTLYGSLYTHQTNKKKIETNFYEAHKNMHFHIHPIKNNFLFGTLSSIPYSKPIRYIHTLVWYVLRKEHTLINNKITYWGT